MSLARLTTVLGSLVLIGGVGAAEVSPDARRLLDDVAKAYKALPAYGDSGEVTLTYVVKPGDAPIKRTTPARIAMSRPNRIAIDAGVVKVISDGKTLRTITPPFSMYRDVPAPASLGLHDLDSGPLGAVEYSGPQGRPIAVILALLLADDPVKALLDDARSVKATPGVKRDGLDRDKLDYEPQVGSILTLWVDPATRLIDRIDVTLSPDGSASGLVPGSPLTVRSLGWTSGAIASKSVPDAAFALVRPEGFTEIARLEKDVARKKAEHELIGQPAPAFTLNVLDGKGKTRPVTTADLAGKVVLLDFWATWCGPCLSELPDIEKLIAAYAKDKKPVVVVAVSIDQADDGDVAEVRALVEKTLKSKEIELQVAPVGLIALDPSATIARQYKANAIPQLVIIDAKGQVRHVHIGVTERDVLMGEIDALLTEAVKP